MCLSELVSNRAFRVLAFLVVMSMLLAPFQSGGAQAQAPVPSEPGPSGPLHQVRSLEIDELGERLAYIRDALSLPYVNGARGQAVNPANGHLLLLDSAAQAIQELSPAGELIASYTYSDVGLRNPQALVFAPTADLTDDPARMHLYVADAGQAPSGSDIRELSFEAAFDLGMLSAAPVTRIQTIDTSLFSTPSNPLAANPSPDPAGITFLPATKHLLISDSEVEEMSIFKGQNVFETTITGTLVSGFTLTNTLGFSNEPTGLAWKQDTTPNRLFVSDDGGTVYEINPATAQVYRSLNTTAFGSIDAEGVSYDPNRKELLIAGGVNSEVYRVAPGPNGLFDGIGDVVTHFDTEALGFTDIEGIDVDPTTGDVYFVGIPRNRLARLSRDGLVLRLFNISAAQNEPGHTYAPAGLALGVTSVPPYTAMSMYISDRGVDNNQVPTENDGRVYEVSLPAGTSGNLAPQVNAGATQTITLPANAILNATVTDLPGDKRPGSTVTWSKASGPGTVQFGNPHANSTTATFTTPGTYVLQLMADDGELIGVGRATVIVKASDGAIAVDTRISYEDDDAEERANGTTNLTHPTLELVWYDGGGDPRKAGNQTVGLRFRDLAIPKAARIKSAYIQFTMAAATSMVTSLTIYGQDLGNPQPFTTSMFNISSRTKTGASVAWSPPAWTTADPGYPAGPNQQTPDLKTIVQTIVDRGDWAIGNPMVFIITGTGQRIATALTAGEMNGRASFHVEYVIPQDQTITVTTPGPGTAAYNTSFPVAATASSGLPVAISTTGVCTGGGSGSASVTMTSGTGTCTVLYNQAGDIYYNAAPEVPENVTAQKVSQVISVTTHAPASAANGESFPVAATADSGLPVAITTTDACTGGGSGSATVTMTGSTGTCTVKYNQAGDDNFDPAPEVTDTITAQPRPIIYLPFIIRH